MSEQDKSKTVTVTATPEWLAEQVTAQWHDDATVLKWANGKIVGLAVPMAFGLGTADRTNVVTVRRWLVEQIEGAYKAGVEAGRKQSLGDCQSWPAEASAALRSAEETSRIAKAEARQSCINDLAAALDSATPVAWDSLMQEVKRLKAAEAVKEKDEAFVRSQVYEYVACLLGIKFAPAVEEDEETLIRWAIERLRANVTAAENQCKSLAEARAEAFTDMANMLDLKREAFDNDDEALVREEIKALIHRSSAGFNRTVGRIQSAEREFGWELAMRHIAQQMALPEDGAVNVVEGRIVAEVARLREGIMRVTLERDSLAYRSAVKGSEVDDMACSRERLSDLRCELALSLGLDGGADWKSVAAAVAAAVVTKTDEVAKARAEGEKAGRAAVLRALENQIDDVGRKYSEAGKRLLDMSLETEKLTAEQSRLREQHNSLYRFLEIAVTEDK